MPSQLTIKKSVAPKLKKRKSVKKLTFAPQVKPVPVPAHATTAALPVVTPVKPAPATPVKPAVKKPIKISKKKSFGSLSEIYQSKATKFALLKQLSDASDSYEQITPLVQCRDFIGDVYTSTTQKAFFGIYGMSWDGTKESPDTDAIKLLVKTPDAASKANLIANARFIHAIEDANSIPRSQIIDNTGNELVIFGDKRWLTNVLYVSLYTFLWRVMCYEIKTEDWVAEIGAQSHSDSRYLASIKKETWSKILANLSLIDTPEFCAMSVASNVSAVHHNAGFISTFGTHSEISYATVKSNPHYQLMITRGIFQETRFK